MNIFKFFIPKSDAREFEAIETYIVEWYSRYGKFSDNVQKNHQAFTSEDDAKAFKARLDDANKLIGNTSQTTVKIRKQETPNGMMSND